MSLLAEALAVTKKILPVSEELDRLSDDCTAFARTVTDHEHRLIRIETTLEIARRSRPSLPGN